MTRPPPHETETVVVTAPPASPTQAVTPVQAVPPGQPAQSDPTTPDPHAVGPRPIGTLTVIAILLLVTLAFWMMVLGVQQGRA